ncbi:hypothetical protein N7G274_008301 [Stereocaulon virgatum]|uniref:Rhodopsin domain-containing protein n=1 Tax=Stereocaulon virgatum TaxID=373712 RepID=A0ABR4A1Y8_9LECA
MASTPSPGVILNYGNPSSLYPEIIATVILSFTLTTVFTAARLLAKRSFSPWTLEDYVLVLAWGCNIAMGSLSIVQGEMGLGRHSWNIGFSDAARLPHMAWIAELAYGPFFWVAKTAVLVQLMRIFTPNKSGAVYWTIHALIWGNLAVYTALFFATAFECSPQDKIWNPHISSGKCLERNIIIFVSAPVDSLSNLLILLLPIWAVWHLCLELKRKVWTIAIFATGVIGLVASICRMVYMTRLCFYDSDQLYVAGQVELWALAEMAAIILCTCFPMMPRFFIWIHSKYRSSQIQSPAPSPYHSHSKSGPVLLARAGVGKNVANSRESYAQIEENDGGPMGWWDRYTGQGIQKTVSIEMTRHDAAPNEAGPSVVV